MAEIKCENWTNRWNWSSYAKLILGANWTHGLTAQSVRASDIYWLNCLISGLFVYFIIAVIGLRCLIFRIIDDHFKWECHKYLGYWKRHQMYHITQKVDANLGECKFASLHFSMQNISALIVNDLSKTTTIIWYIINVLILMKVLLVAQLFHYLQKMRIESLYLRFS